MKANQIKKVIKGIKHTIIKNHTWVKHNSVIVYTFTVSKREKHLTLTFKYI